MNEIPEDITPILREIDEVLKAKGVPPHARGIRAVIAFGQRFQLNIPLVAVKPHKPDLELAKNSTYTARIYDWFEEVYGERMKFDPSDKVAVIADGDLWELRIPLIYGTVIVDARNDFLNDRPNIFSASPVKINACAALTHITPARLKCFRDSDLQEVYGSYCVGLDTRAAFDRFRKADSKFLEAESDWKAAVMHLTAQRPNFGQSRWSSLQMCEKFMKGMIKIIGGTHARPVHNLSELHEALALSIPALNLVNLLPDIQCTAAVRYGEAPSTREQAYTAHKSSLLLVRALGSVKNANE
jgi:hypothetical protein